MTIPNDSNSPVEGVTLMHGDCLELMSHIPDGSVDLILTDLPYGTMKGAQLDGWNGVKTDWDTVINTDRLMIDFNRLLRKNGKLVLFSQQPFTTELINAAIANLPFCYSMTWEKDHFANSLVAKKAPVSYTEDVLVFSKKHDYEGIHPLRSYFSLVMDFIGLSKKELISKIGQKADHVFRTSSTQFSLCTESTYDELIDVFSIDRMRGFRVFQDLKKDDLPSTFNLWQGGKYKSNILKYKKDYDGHHPTQKPIALLEDLIQTFSNKGDTVLDATMGSGSTGVAALNTNRKFIGIEQDDNYFSIADKRVAEAASMV